MESLFSCVGHLTLKPPATLYLYHFLNVRNIKRFKTQEQSWSMNKCHLSGMSCSVLEQLCTSASHHFMPPYPPLPLSFSFPSTLLASLGPLLTPCICPSGVGWQQAACQAEANRGEPGAPSKGGTAEDGVGPTGAHPRGVGPHPYGDRSPYGHKRPGQPLEAEAEIPGETSSSFPPHQSLDCIDYCALFKPPTPLIPTYLPLPPISARFQPVPAPFRFMSPSPPLPPPPLFHCSLC